MIVPLRKIGKNISEMVDAFTSFESKIKAPFWLFTIVTTILYTSVGFLFGAYVHPFLLLVFTCMPIYPVYFSQFKAQQYKKAAFRVLLWAITISFTIVLLTVSNPSLASRAVISGTSYKEEMFLWIATGEGAEGDPSAFVPAHLINAAFFTLLSFATGGLLALLFGAYQMNYMNFYVGELLSRVAHPTLNNFIIVSLLSWPVYSIIRVLGFVCIGVATTIPLASKTFKKKIDSKPLTRLLITGVVLVGLDIAIKAFVAPYYQKLLHELISVSQ